VIQNRFGNVNDHTHTDAVIIKQKESAVRTFIFICHSKYKYMISIRLQLLTLLSAISCLTISAVTPISGMINNDSVLRKSQSPYLVTSNLVIFPAGKLTIEPGVEVRFASNVKLEVRGKLIAEGAKNDTIIFTSDSGINKGSWTGIEIKNAQGGSASFNYCKISNALIAINGLTTSKAVSNSYFLNNNTVFYGVGMNNIIIDSCRFEKNDKVHWEPMVINFTNCILRDNTIGIGTAGYVKNCLFDSHTDFALSCYSWENGKVLNNTFTNNKIAFKCGIVGDVKENIFLNNKTAILIYEQRDFTIQDNKIENNVVGIQFDKYSQGMIITDNQICNNSSYNIKNATDLNIKLYDNCWCTSDSLIVENKIYDGFDNLESGLVDYTIYSDDCSNKILKTLKLENKVIYLTSEMNSLVGSKIKLYPNPASDYLFLDICSENKVISIFSYSGILMIRKYNSDRIEGTVQMDISSLSKGLYLVELIDNTGHNILRKIIVE
jgi:hypothetical protein